MPKKINNSNDRIEVALDQLKNNKLNRYKKKEYTSYRKSSRIFDDCYNEKKLKNFNSELIDQIIANKFSKTRDNIKTSNMNLKTISNSINNHELRLKATFHSLKRCSNQMSNERKNMIIFNYKDEKLKNFSEKKKIQFLDNSTNTNISVFVNKERQLIKTLYDTQLKIKHSKKTEDTYFKEQSEIQKVIESKKSKVKFC